MLGMLEECWLLGISTLSCQHTVVVQLLSHVWLLATPWTAAHQAHQSFPTSRSLLKCISIEWVMPSNHLILCFPLLLPLIFPSIRVFSNELALHDRWPKCWSFSISPSKEYSGLIYFRINWFDILDIHGTLKRLFQHQNSRPSILWHSVVLMVQLSHPYMTIGKTIALTLWTYECQHGCTYERQIWFKKKKKTILYMCVCARLWPTLCNFMDCSLQGFSVHRIFQARILEWVAVSSLRGSSQPRDWAQVSGTAEAQFYM